MKRRKALWQVEEASRQSGPLFDSMPSVSDSGYPLPDMNALERLQADYRGTKLTTGPHPMALVREFVSKKGAVSVSRLVSTKNGQRVRVAGGIIVRQRPLTARGFLFLSLEDETGIANIVVKPPVFKKNRVTLVSHPFLLIEGVLQNSDNVVSVLANRFWPLEIQDAKLPSHDFH